MYVVDGLDITTSNITPGVLNLVPDPDTIQEATVQVNTFDVEYGRSSSIVEVMTTRSGANRYHFLASQYYTANWLTARTQFQPSETFKMLPFHSSNISATLSGPVPFLKNTFFFTGWEPMLSSTQSSSQVTYEDPQFIAWAKTNWPNSVGVSCCGSVSRHKRHHHRGRADRRYALQRHLRYCGSGQYSVFASGC